MTGGLNFFALYNLTVGAIAAVGLIYLLYTQLAIVEFQHFLTLLFAGLLLFSVGSPLANAFAPSLSHFVHGVAALFVVFSLYNPVHNDLRKNEWASLLFTDPTWIRHPAEWMAPMDNRILELFHSTELVLTPAIIAYNIDFSRSEVNRRLSELQSHGFVEKPERGKYRLTERGDRYLRGEDTDRATVPDSH